jgi:hypothetical protein
VLSARDLNAEANSPSNAARCSGDVELHSSVADRAACTAASISAFVAFAPSPRCDSVAASITGRVFAAIRNRPPMNSRAASTVVIEHPSLLAFGTLLHLDGNVSCPAGILLLYVNNNLNGTDA